MNDAVPVSSDGFLTTAGLAARPDFTLGLAVVSPSTRTIAGPGGTADVEPRVMQVLLVLADAAGQVVTRERLFHRCWGSVYVGDDSLNRAIGAVRKLATGIADCSFEVETIPRTGYRLTGGAVGALDTADVQAARPGVSRRALVGGGAGALLLVSGGAWWSIRSLEHSRANERFDKLIDQAETAIRNEDANLQVVRALETAVALRPGSAKAWGLLAFFNVIVAQLSDPKDAEPLIAHAQDAARRALSIDPTEPNALLAMFELEGSTLDWFARDQKLRRIIAIDPSNIWAIAELVLLLQAAGMSAESWRWNERAIALVPLSEDFLSKRALKLWLAGRVSEADKVIDQVRALHPTDEWARFVRFLIFATTGRVEAAQAMLRSNLKMIFSPPEAVMWRAALPAFVRPSSAAISRTRALCFDAAKLVGQSRGQGVMILSQLRDLDGAFAIANGALLGRGPIIREEQPGSRDATEDATDRINMQWMFTPPCAALRADPRFGPLCDGIGLSDYWRRRGVEPDFMKTDR